MKTRIAAVIPARMASSRFPGKPLIEIRGLPMLEHVRRRAEKCRFFSDVVVATCDEEIRTKMETFGANVVMTSEKHRVATERIAEALGSLHCTHVVNVQGDELLILPNDLERFAQAMASEPERPVWNAVAPLTQNEELSDLAAVKCLLSPDLEFLYCSRNFSTLPFPSQERFDPAFRVLGILGYTCSFLEKFVSMEPTPLELMESIEQMRIIENHSPIKAVPFEKGYPGVNNRDELRLAEQYLDEDPQQKIILKEIGL